MPFLHPRCLFLVFFSACAQQGSMLTLASSSRVPFPNSTNVQWSIGIFFPYWGLVLTFFFRLAPRSIKKQGLEQVLGAPWEFFLLFLLFFPWNSWIPISREFSIANFKSYGDYRSLDLSIAWFNRLLVDRENKNSVDRDDTKFRRSRK